MSDGSSLSKVFSWSSLGLLGQSVNPLRGINVGDVGQVGSRGMGSIEAPSHVSVVVPARQGME